jgi:hypothetical protein
MNRIWRNLPEPDGRAVLLFITAAGAEAIGVDPAAVPHAFNERTNSTGEPAADAPTGADEAPAESAPKRRRGRPRKMNTAAPPKTRNGTKQAQLIAVLRQPDGTTIAQKTLDLGAVRAGRNGLSRRTPSGVSRCGRLARRPRPSRG